VFLLCVMCSSTTAERQSLASGTAHVAFDVAYRLGLCVLCFRGSIAHPTQSLCTLRTRRRRRPRNTRYRRPLTAYPDRSLTGRTRQLCLAHKQSILSLQLYGLLRGACHRARIRATELPPVASSLSPLAGLPVDLIRAPVSGYYDLPSAGIGDDGDQTCRRRTMKSPVVEALDRGCGHRPASASKRRSGTA